ncbi:hypothetical protein DID96_11110 [Burkholderia sp. Bp8963]|uniref:DUF6622 family protein n=1 Tax=Burkholderia sp. Bp8963 TaxID=2184547 RepID=UPI000F5AF8AC|nr:DUF6622 family protein [Burkholderia sp. Bp8963]RQS72293.1 hypothetical protein DID96_11110 [Burkholderia sp. Bp8963]
MNPILHLKSYVYVLFCALLYIGIKRCFPREVPAARQLLTPVALVAFALLGLSSLNRLFPHAGSDANAIALASLVVGATLGWLHARRWRLHFRDGVSGLRVRLPGDASLLVTLMLTFAAESCMHYAVDSGQPWAQASGFVALSFAVWGVLVGMPLGRALNVVVRCLRHANGSLHDSARYTADPR